MSNFDVAKSILTKVGKKSVSVLQQKAAEQQMKVGSYISSKIVGALQQASGGKTYPNTIANRLAALDLVEADTDSLTGDVSGPEVTEATRRFENVYEKIDDVSEEMGIPGIDTFDWSVGRKIRFALSSVEDGEYLVSMWNNMMEEILFGLGDVGQTWSFGEYSDPSEIRENSSTMSIKAIKAMTLLGKLLQGAGFGALALTLLVAVRESSDWKENANSLTTLAEDIDQVVRNIKTDLVRGGDQNASLIRGDLTMEKVTDAADRFSERLLHSGSSLTSNNDTVESLVFNLLAYTRVSSVDVITEFVAWCIIHRNWTAGTAQKEFARIVGESKVLQARFALQSRNKLGTPTS